ncbi:MAG: peptidoglycan-associated lipoprotein Pal [Gammaproteobacteria bacterium]|jgi:peptidoglycan-associated lipoprotein
MKKWIKVGLIIIPVLMLGACGTTGGVKKQEGAGGQGAGEKAPESATTTPVTPGGGEEATPLPGGATGMEGNGAPSETSGLLSKKVVYFDFDSSTVHDDDRAIIQAHADYLAKHPDVKVTLEGNTDERGSREYNIGLGERRAKAVAEMMKLMGVSADQISTVSYGEERPAALGHDEAAWSLNRRVEIVYGGP